MILRLWLLLVLTLAGAQAPSRACARIAETRTGVFLFETGNTCPATAAQVADSRLGFAVFGYETVSGCCLAAENGAAKGFFEGTSYTPKVLKQMEGGVGEFHSFPESVTAFENAGTVRTITGGDTVVRQVLEIPGSYGGRDGVFQFIKNADGTINHRLFVPTKP